MQKGPETAFHNSKKTSKKRIEIYPYPALSKSTQNLNSKKTSKKRIEIITRIVNMLEQIAKFKENLKKED